MAALVAAALAQVGDRPAWLVVILADRYRRPMVVLVAAAAAVAVAAAIAVVGGALLAPMLAPAARELFLALALLLQGAGAMPAVKAPDRLNRWRLGAAGTSFLGLFILAFGDGLQFIVLALAVRSATPWLAVVAAVLGSLAVLTPAAFLGERAWIAAPLGIVRRAIGGLFCVAGIVLGVQALRLI